MGILEKRWPVREGAGPAARALALVDDGDALELRDGREVLHRYRAPASVFERRAEGKRFYVRGGQAREAWWVSLRDREGGGCRDLRIGSLRKMRELERWLHERHPNWN